MKIKIIYIIILTCLIPGILSGEKDPKIIVINSNASIEKYRVPQDEFKKAIIYPIVEVDLFEAKWKLAKIKQFLEDENPDLVYCIGSKAYFIANKYISEKYIVFSSIINWLRMPMSQKTFGVSNELHAEMQLMMFRYIFPNIQKVAVLYSQQYTNQWFKQTTTQAKDVGVEIVGTQMTSRKNKLALLKQLLSEADAFWLIPDPMVMADENDLFEILKLCDSMKKPVFSYNTAFAAHGATLIVSVDTPTIGRQVAVMAEQIIKKNIDKNESMQKIQFPAGSRITLNLKKVRAFGWHYNADALDSVNDIIE